MCDEYTVVHESSRLFDSTKVVWWVLYTLWCMNPACTLIVLRWSGVCVCACMSVHVHISSLSWWAVNDEFLTHTHTCRPSWENAAALRARRLSMKLVALLATPMSSSQVIHYAPTLHEEGKNKSEGQREKERQTSERQRAISSLPLGVIHYVPTLWEEGKRKNKRERERVGTEKRHT